MMITLSRLYPDGRIARAIVAELKAAGLPEDDIGIIAPSRGGVAGLLAGLGAFVLPGIGAVVASGALASALTGAVAAGTAAGIVGALIEAGISENDAARFAEGIRRGDTLVTVRTMDQDRNYYEGVLAVTQVPKVAGSYEPAGMPVQLRGVNPLDIKRP